MMARESFNALRQTVMVAWPQASAAAARTLLLKTAREGHARIMADAAGGGAAPDFVAYANNPGNTNLESVKLPGPIVYRYDYRRRIVAVALAELRRRSPRDSGKYAESHLLFLNGAPVENLPPRLAPTDEIWIANPVPYARRLEVGKTKAGRDFVIHAAAKIYERTVKAPVNLRGRYKNIASVEFSYVTIPGAWIIKGRLSPTYKTGKIRKRRSKKMAAGDAVDQLLTVKRQQARHIGQPVRAPAIIIRAFR